MNETFSDLSAYPGLEGTNAAPTFFHEVADDSLAAGDVYVLGHGRGHLQQRVRVPHGRLHGQHGRRRVPLCALRFGRGGQPRLLLPRSGVRHPRDSPGRGSQLAARPHLRAARIRRRSTTSPPWRTPTPSATSSRTAPPTSACWRRSMRETGPSSSSTSPSRTTAATTRGSCPPPMRCTWNRTRWKAPRWTSSGGHPALGRGSALARGRAERAERAHHRRVLRRPPARLRRLALRGDLRQARGETPVWKRCRRATGRRISSGRTLRPAGSTGIRSRASRTPTSRA